MPSALDYYSNHQPDVQSAGPNATATTPSPDDPDFHGTATILVDGNKTLYSAEAGILREYAYLRGVAYLETRLKLVTNS